jgi:hypothetical protein
MATLTQQSRKHLHQTWRLPLAGSVAPAVAVVPDTWQPWLESLFPAYVAAGFSERHAAFWEWVWAVGSERPRPFVAIWPRGGGKSTSAEMACVALAARAQRRYCLYVCETQDQADDHVANIAALLESAAVASHYPALADRAVGKHGNSKGWRRNRLRTAAGFTVDALGLDVAARGAKLDEHRPDVMIFDDLDGEHDTPATTEKKISTITRKLLPAGAANLAVLAIQNLVHPDSIFARLADGRADFLTDRIVSGPHPAVQGLATEQCDGKTVVVAGDATWPGQSIAGCQDMIDSMGISAFLQECQHQVTAPAGGLFDHLAYRHCTWQEVPDLVSVEVWCDPAVTDSDRADSHGIQADGIAADDTVYRLWSWEQRGSPEDTIRRALLKAYELGADAVGVETDQGGQTWQSVAREAWRRLVEDEDYPDITTETHRPRLKSAKAGAIGSKTHRAQQMLAAYERGEIVHVIGTHAVLEAALRRFPKTKPFDLVDAAYWSWRALTKGRLRVT